MKYILLHGKIWEVHQVKGKAILKHPIPASLLGKLAQDNFAKGIKRAWEYQTG